MMLGLRWLKNSSGKQDAMLTFATASFALTSLCILLSMVESVSTAGAANVVLKAPSETLVLGYLGAAFTSYVLRRNKKDHLEAEQAKVEMQNGILPGGE